MARWKCDNCGTVHRRNPSKCKNCGHTILVQDRSEPDESDRDYRKLAIVAAAIVLVVLVVVALSV
ncbi:MAG: hypothetical protein ABEI96_01515 [Haloarculaceae archaeon]